ncbi:MAG: 2-oxoacid:acceptor oxidoreductase family protein [bacterium]|nr:2-oxoacid:acceptor oxidoreductase family protein [bacterium]
MQQERIEIRLTGSGGQGLVTAGIILAEAAGIYEGKQAVQTQSYGPEARGGASKSEVVIGTVEIDYPKVINPNILLAMTQVAAEKYLPDIKENGISIIDSTFVTNISARDRVYLIPISKIAKEKTGKMITANIVALGVLIAITNIVSRKAIEQAVLGRVPKGTEKLNLTALQAGYTAGEEALKKIPAIKSLESDF